MALYARHADESKFMKERLQGPRLLYLHSHFPLLQSAQASDTAAQLKTHLPLAH